jgi:hypothetical protein
VTLLTLLWEMALIRIRLSKGKLIAYDVVTTPSTRRSFPMPSIPHIAQALQQVFLQHATQAAEATLFVRRTRTLSGAHFV